MRLTNQTNYAVRMLMYCAAADRQCRVREIADLYGLSEAFLLKILRQLTAKGFMTTVRGRAGGVRLARPAAEIRLGEVVRAMEGFTLAECFEPGSECPILSSCGFNGALNEALAAFLAVLDRTTLADLVDNERNLNVLVELNRSKEVPFRPSHAIAASRPAGA